MGVVTSFGVAIILTRSFLCANIEMQWNWNANNKCGSNWAAMLAESVINALINTVIICMPMPILWRLKMGVDRKILLTIVFGVGIIAVSITILRFVSVAQASDDWQSAVVRVALWTNLEAMLGILCACLPLIRPAVARVFYLATGRVALQSSSKPTPAISSTVARIRQKSHAGNQSQGIMEDQYPLTEGRNWRDPEHTTGARTNTTAVGKREVERKGNVVSQSPEDRIRVQSEWYVTRE
ncbi:hypothetical protein MMC10_001927 [Thelotrema lepadinum]|nr:hypothetical protein [Thelotrema lepadinum]